MLTDCIGGASCRLESIVALQIEKFHADAEERKKEKEAAKQRKGAAAAGAGGTKRGREGSANAAAGAGAAAASAAGATPAAAGSGGEEGDDGPAASGATAATATTGAAEEEPPAKKAKGASGAATAAAGGGGGQEVSGGPGGSGANGSVTGREVTPGVGGTQGGEGASGTPGTGLSKEQERARKEAAHEADLARLSIRTEPLGLDRNYQRYWMLQSAPGVIFVEGSEGDKLGVISSKKQLDEVMAGLNDKGAREAGLLQMLKRRYQELSSRLQPLVYPLNMADVPRDTGAAVGTAAAAVAAKRRDSITDSDGSGSTSPPEPKAKARGKTKVEDYGDLQAAAEAKGVQSALAELEVLVSQLVGAGFTAMGVKDWRRRLKGKETVQQLCETLLEFEGELSALGDGVPKGASDEELAEVVKEADIYEAEFVLPVSEAELAATAAEAGEEGQDGPGLEGGDEKGGGEEGQQQLQGVGDGGGGEGGEGQPQQQLALPAGGGRVKMRPATKAGAPAAVDVDGGAGAAPMDIDRGFAMTAGGAPSPSAKGIKREQQEGGEQEEGDEEDAGPQTKLVSPLEELDDSDVEAEKRYQEKRAAEKACEPVPPPPAVVWRSVRERAVWLKDVRRALLSNCIGGAAYAAAALVDRAQVGISAGGCTYSRFL